MSLKKSDKQNRGNNTRCNTSTKEIHTSPTNDDSCTPKIRVMEQDEMYIMYCCITCKHVGRCYTKLPSTRDKILNKAIKTAAINHAMTNLLCDMKTFDLCLEDYKGNLI